MDLGDSNISKGSHRQSDTAVASFMSSVYRWMTMGLLFTAFIAFMINQDRELLITIASNKLLFYGCIFAELGLVIYLSARITKMSATAAIASFLTYAGLNGVTFSVFTLIYTGSSIQNAFIAAACSFTGLSIFGLVTKRDLGPVGTFCHMGLWGIVIFSILGLFIPSMHDGQMGLVFSMVGILVFAGLTAYDTQKIKTLSTHFPEGSEESTKYSIMGALTLYLDFINLFLFLLRIMGRRR